MTSFLQLAFLGALVPALTIGPAPEHLRSGPGVDDGPGASHYVTPQGGPRGDGTRQRPWDLATALRGGAGRIRPGDTVWLGGGRYVGTDFRTELRGRPDARITFRQAPGERATIDGRLLARGAYLDFWGFEITQSDPLAHPDVQLLDARTDHGRFINLVLHDANTHGANFWTPGVNAELYGCIVYNNGTHENLDHGVYVHNETGTKLIADNIFFNNYARGIQVYATARNPVLRNVHVLGNVSFNNGTISQRSTRVNLLFNAEAPMEGMVAAGNLLYFSPGAGGINIRLGRHRYRYGDIALRENFAVGGRRALEMEQPWREATIEHNTFVGGRETDAVLTTGPEVGGRYRWAGNVFVREPRARAWRHDGISYDFESWRRRTGFGPTDRAAANLPSSPTVVIRPNKYEPGRAYIAIVNWRRASSVAVDVAGVLRPGQRYEVRNVQDLWGSPVAEGTYRGGPIQLPMAGVVPPRPVGRQAPRAAPRTGPDFDVFVLTVAR